MMTDRFPIVSQTELAPGIFQMVLQTPQMAQEARPGQLVDLYCAEKDKLLPRPISLFDADPEEGTLSLIYAVYFFLRDRLHLIKAKPAPESELEELTEETQEGGAY